jgi:hypothetical protein
VSAWLVIGDADLRALLLTIGEEARFRLLPIAPEEASARLDAGDVPDAMLTTQELLSLRRNEGQALGVERLVIATASHRDDASAAVDGARYLALPADLDEIEQTLRWVALHGAAPDDSGYAGPASRDSSSALA